MNSKTDSCVIPQITTLQVALIKAGLCNSNDMSAMYEGLKECMKNVTRCNRAKKLSYCIARR